MLTPGVSELNCIVAHPTGVRDSENKKFRNSKDADVENGPEDTGSGKGKPGRSERVAWTYTLPNVKQIASGKQPHSTGRSAQCFVTT